jgi:GTP-dependent phosphoenolpyruvate carboxykinase
MIRILAAALDHVPHHGRDNDAWPPAYSVQDWPQGIHMLCLSLSEQTTRSPSSEDCKRVEPAELTTHLNTNAEYHARVLYIYIKIHATSLSQTSKRYLSISR